MNTRNKKITISTLIVVVFASIIAFAAVAFPSKAMLSFSGIKMVTNNSKTQGFVDINLKNVNTTNFSFCLKYDTNYIELSDADTNAPIQNNTTASDDTDKASYNREYKYFKQNKEAFPGDNFRNTSATPIGVADAENGTVIMNFLPKKDLNAESEYIGTVEGDEEEKMNILAADKEVQLGQLSFKIKNPFEFAKLTKEELNDIIKIVPFDNMPGVVNFGTEEDTGLYIGYYDKEIDDVSWYSDVDEYVEYNFEIDNELSSVKPLTDELTVSSYEIYNDGTMQDLFDFLNRRMSTIVLEYSDGSTVPTVIEWNSENSQVNQIEWNAKGGTYKVTQDYNENYSITVTVNVTPINLVGYDVENPNITYWVGDEENYPKTFEDLKLAKKARPIIDTYIPNLGIPECDIENYSMPDVPHSVSELPDEIKNKVAGKYTFWGNLKNPQWYEAYPWLTRSSEDKITFTRNVVESEDELPKTLVVERTSTDEAGRLTIVVSNSDGSDIPDETVFSIKMPGGEIIDNDNIDEYTSTISDGKATITIKADITKDDQKKLAQLINLGNRAGQFAISSTEPNKKSGPYTSFETDPRENRYINGNYELDYSKQNSAMFPIKANEELPTTVTIPIPSDYIATTYSGYDGTESGALETFKVDSWTVLEGEPNVVGQTVTVKGRLSDTTYTNYGEVKNPNDYEVTIKYLVVAGEDKDQIAEIEDFAYDKQRVEYDYDDLQTHSFTVKNIGATDIYGLTATISLSKATYGTEVGTEGKEAFVITKKLPQILQKGDSVDFDITTKYGLDVGNYECDVSVMSNDGVLRSFIITFEVKDTPIYKIIIDSDSEDCGSAKTESESYTAEPEEEITIIAEPKEECVFKGWTTVDGENVDLADENALKTTFEMPENDVHITAHFEESLGAKLRATELLVKDSDDNTQDLYDETWQTVQFDPVKREYYVVVPNNIENVKIWFKLREEAEQATLALTHKHGDETTDMEISEKGDDEYYKSNEAVLDVSPVDNLLELTMILKDEEDKDVTKSYKIHVYRKIQESNLMVFDYGNSPYGLIMRDGNLDKDLAKEKFVENDYTFVDGYTPSGAEVGTMYCEEAWANGDNYDLNDSALFVINSKAFKDSGYKKVVNSIGGEVTDVTKKITVNVLTKSNDDEKDGSPEDYSEVKQEVIDLPAGDDTISELSTRRIRPDHYEIVYSFTDFDGSIVSIRKPLILLNSLGDINNDNVANSSDSDRIKNRFGNNIANNLNVENYEEGGLLNRYRICDVNKDRAVNLIDANNINKGEISPFYINYGGGT